MEVAFAPEQEAQLSELAAMRGVSTKDLLLDGAARLLEDRQIEDALLAGAHADPEFDKAVQRGIEQADRGELISHEEVVARFERRFGG